jgi:translocation and assembly module TamA
VPPDPYLIHVDAERIRGEYLRRGFLSVDVTSRVVRRGDAVDVIYQVQEGRRARTRVEITGLPDDPSLPVATVRAALPLEDGAPFDYATYEEAKGPLRTIVEDAGYAHVELDARVVADRVNDIAIVQLAYVPGPKSSFGTVTITGAEGALREAVERRVRFHPGQRYSLTAISSTQRALYALNRFSTVQVIPEKDGTDPVVDTKIAVTEGSRREIRLGGGFGIEPAGYELRGRAGYTIAGWPFPLDTFTLDLRPAYARIRDLGGYEPRIRALARIARQDLFTTYALGSAELEYDYLAYEAYTTYGPRARLLYTLPIGTRAFADTLQLGVGWSIHYNGFRNIHPLLGRGTQVAIGLDEHERVSALQQSAILDLRDHPLEPRRGLYAELRLAEAARFLGSAFDFLQVAPELRGYVPVGPVVVAARARTAITFGDLAPTERLFSGGASRHRGFSERKLAPSVFGDVDGSYRSIPYGGGALVETSLEVRIPIATIREMPLGGVVFLDGGDVTEELGTLDVTNLHWAVGVGLRLSTIVGPVRGDVGYRLNRTGPMEPDPYSRVAFHLSLGEAF